MFTIILTWKRNRLIRGQSNTGGENVSKVESKSKKQFDTVIFIDKTGKRLTKRAKSVFLQESDSGDKLVLQCNGLKEFENLSSVTKKEASTSAKSVRRRATGKRKRKRRGRKKEGFSNTVSEIKFWDKIYTQLGTIKSKNIQSKNTSTAVNVSGEKEENRNESPKSVSRKSPKNTSSANDLLRLSREKIENIDRWLSTLEVPDIHKKGLEHTNTEVKDDELSNEEKADMEKRRDGSPQPGTSGAVTRDVVDKKTKHYERDDVRRKYRHRVDASDGVRERYIRHVRRKDRHKTAKSKSSCVVM